MIVASSVVFAYFGRPLTAREKQIAGMVAKGLPNKAIAQMLNITCDTVKIHIMAIFVKLGCENRVQVAMKCQELVTE